MSRKHTVRINVADKLSGKQEILQSRELSLPKRLLKWLFGDCCKVMVLTPADSVTSIEVKEVMGGEI